MTKFKVSYNLVVYLFILLIIGAGFYFLKPQKQPPAIQEAKSVINYDNPRYSEWAKLIDTLGVNRAYEKFKEINKKNDPGLAHTNAHNFGEVLYSKAGLDGVSVCDTEFAYGCYHTFLGSAIHFHGLEVVTGLNQKCIDNLGSQALACQHGIGHGLVSYLGYDLDFVNQSLQICKNLPANDPIGGCYGGVFMEYNFENMLVEEGKTRSYDKSDPLFPCDKLESSFTNSCYYWQPQWWAQVLDGDNNTRFKKISNFCENLTVATNRDNCFIGIGNITGQLVNWDTAKAKQLCSFTSDPHFNLLCIAGTAGSFWAEPTVREKAYEVCTFPKTDLTEKCIKQAGLRSL